MYNGPKLVKVPALMCLRLVTERVHLQQWADLLKECQSCPTNMNVENQCSWHGITKVNYYYQLRWVRQVVLALAPNSEPIYDGLV